MSEKDTHVFIVLSACTNQYGNDYGTQPYYDNIRIVGIFFKLNDAAKFIGLDNSDQLVSTTYDTYTCGDTFCCIDWEHPGNNYNQVYKSHYFIQCSKMHV
jgi:hypothetical protein